MPPNKSDSDKNAGAVPIAHRPGDVTSNVWMSETSKESLKAQIQLLVSSAQKGNALAVNSLLLWTRADPRAPHIISDRQVESLRALRQLVTKDKQRFGPIVVAFNGHALVQPYTGAPDATVAALADDIIGHLPLQAASGDEHAQPAVWSEPAEKRAVEASLERDLLELDDATVAWADERGYDPNEIYEFKEAWAKLEAAVGGNMLLDHFTAFIIAQFGMIDAALLSQLQKLDTEGQSYSFMDFLKYMDKYESFTESESGSDGDGGDMVYDDDYDEEESSDEDSFYLGREGEEPHTTLRQFLGPDADYKKLMASLRPTDADYAAIFNDDVVAKMKSRCTTVWDDNLLETVLPVHRGQQFVGVYVIAEEYKELWRQLRPLLKANVVAYGFDFNTEARFSARGSATYAFVAEVNGQWRLFPSRWLTMSDPEFTRRLDPALGELKALADRVMENKQIVEIGQELRPSLSDWEALFTTLELAHRAHDLYEKSVAVQVEGAPPPMWNIGPGVAHPYGVAIYHRYELLSAHVSDFESNTKLSRRLAAKFPQTYRRLVPHMKPKTLLCGLRLDHGLMLAPNPNAQVPPQYRTEEYQYREGDHAPAKTFSLLVKVNDQWRYFPKKILFHALGVAPNAEDSTSEVDFYDSSEVSDDYSDEYYGDDAYIDEGGAERAVEEAPAAGWTDNCTLM